MPQAKANGITLEYDIYGKPTDPPVVLIMGFSGQLIMWPISFVNGLVAKGFRVIRFDNRDVGLSTHLTEAGVPDIGAIMGARAMGKTPEGAPYVLEDMAKDVIGLLDALKIDTAHIVGASMGGMIAQLCAIHDPGRCRSMTSIMSTTGRPTLTQARPEIMAVLMTPPKSPSREDRIAAFVHTFKTIGSPGFPAPEEEMNALGAAMADRAPPDQAGIARQMAAIMSSPPRHESLAKVRVPSLILHGADDPLVPVEGGRDTSASIPGSEEVIIPGMGHDFTEALMPEFIKYVGDFITRTEARAKAA